MIPIDKDNFKQTNDLYCYINAFESRRAARGILFAWYRHTIQKFWNYQIKNQKTHLGGNFYDNSNLYNDPYFRFLSWSWQNRHLGARRWVCINRHQSGIIFLRSKTTDNPHLECRLSVVFHFIGNHVNPDKITPSGNIRCTEESRKAAVQRCAAPAPSLTSEISIAISDRTRCATDLCVFICAFLRSAGDSTQMGGLKPSTKSSLIQ